MFIKYFIIILHLVSITKNHQIKEVESIKNFSEQVFYDLKLGRIENIQSIRIISSDSYEKYFNKYSSLIEYDEQKITKGTLEHYSKRTILSFMTAKDDYLFGECSYDLNKLNFKGFRDSTMQIGDSPLRLGRITLLFDCNDLEGSIEVISFFNGESWMICNIF